MSELRLAVRALCAVALLAAMFLPDRALHAQVVERTGAGDVALDRRLDRLLEDGGYVLVRRDTLITDTVPAPLLVLDATLTLEGVVEGDLVAVDANVFLRPGARVAGDALNQGGGLYRSALAAVEGDVYDYPDARYTVTRTAEGVRIEAEADEPRLDLDGVFGFHVPEYDRVDGLWLTWGADYRLPALGAVQPVVHGEIGYRTELDDLTGGAELRLERGPFTLSAGAYRLTATNDEWVRGDLKNSGSFLLNGNDYRNYYDAERRFVRLGWAAERVNWELAAELGAWWEDAESLPTGDPFTLFDDPPYRFNPRINEGTIASLLLFGEGEWVGSSSAVEGWLAGELAGEVLGGDASFGRVSMWGEWAMEALFDHVLEVEWFAQGLMPGTDALPRQRWTHVGGTGGLQTFDIAEFRGDRVVYAETAYIIPLPDALRLPILGVPDLHLLHGVGMAWTEALDRDLVQNLGVRIQFFSLYFRYMVDPADPLDDSDFDIGLSWPFDDSYPWERGG